MYYNPKPVHIISDRSTDQSSCTIILNQYTLFLIDQQPGAVKLVLWRHWMHLAELHASSVREPISLHQAVLPVMALASLRELAVDLKTANFHVTHFRKWQCILEHIFNKARYCRTEKSDQETCRYLNWGPFANQANALPNELLVTVRGEWSSNPT